MFLALEEKPSAVLLGSVIGSTVACMTLSWAASKFYAKSKAIEALKTLQPRWDENTRELTPGKSFQARRGDAPDPRTGVLPPLEMHTFDLGDESSLVRTESRK